MEDQEQIVIVDVDGFSAVLNRLEDVLKHQHPIDVLPSGRLMPPHFDRGEFHGFKSLDCLYDETAICVDKTTHKILFENETETSVTIRIVKK